MQKAAVEAHSGHPTSKTDLVIGPLHPVWFFYFGREINHMATEIHVISSTSLFPYLKEHGTETCMWWKSWFHWKIKGKISLTSEMSRFHPRTKMVVPHHPRCSQEMKIIPQTSEENQTTPPLSGRLLTACSIKAPAGNSAVGNRLSCAWKVNKKTNAGVQHWLTSSSAFSWHFWVALPCSAPQKHFKWCGRYFMWKNKACCMGLKGILLLFHPSFKLLFKSRLY